MPRCNHFSLQVVHALGSVHVQPAKDINFRGC